MNAAPIPMADAPSPGSTHRDVISADDVAVLLGLNRKTVYAAATRNQIPHRRLGKRILFSRAAIVRWLAGEQHSKGSSIGDKR